jgi:four helix bundle protein
VKIGGEREQRDIRERTFQFSLNIVRLFQDLDKQSNTARILGKQLLRSGTSIGANVEEAQAGQSKANFINKNAIALKEARETIYWLRILKASEIA